jgi:hypothetical protein
MSTRTDPLIEFGWVDATKVSTAILRAVQRGPADPIGISSGIEKLQQQVHPAFVPEVIICRQ